MPIRARNRTGLPDTWFSLHDVLDEALAGMIQSSGRAARTDPILALRSE